MCQMAVSMEGWIATLAFWGSAAGGDAAVAGAEAGTRVWAQAIAAVPGAPCR